MPNSHHSRHNPPNPSPPTGTGRHRDVSESSPTTTQVVTPPQKVEVSASAVNAQSTGSDGFEPIDSSKIVNGDDSLQVVTGSSPKPEITGSDDVQPFREGQIVYPTTGKYQGKQCKVSAIANDGSIWAYPITTQLGVPASQYQPSELSLTQPVAASTVEEYDYYQLSLGWDGEDYLEALDD
ncbi:MAG: hypothetical protein HC907_21595 [Richelia sp. SM1_7_0]|nr:hypothetical protein [Richelia sp. SM1_7_0]